MDILLQGKIYHRHFDHSNKGLAIPFCRGIITSLSIAMWDIDNRTPYSAAASWTRGIDGVHRWLVCVKATFDLDLRGSATLAEEQLEPLLLPKYWGEPGASSIRYDVDVVEEKPTTDLLVNATAYAPQQRPAREFFVGLRAGSITKQLKVFGDRVYMNTLTGPSPSRAIPTTQIPLRWERAYGGYDDADPNPSNHRLEPRNPVGRGVARRAADLVGKPVANIEYASGASAPAGFGALDSFWSPRAELQGTYDSAWIEHRRPLLPTDWSPQSLLCSPCDQRPRQHFRGGELIELSNMSPDGVLRVVLPKIALGFRTKVQERVEVHRASLGTVLIEPDDRRLIMAFQTSLSIRGNPDYLDETIVYEKTRE